MIAITSANVTEFPWANFNLDPTALQRNENLKIYKLFNETTNDNIAFILSDNSGPAKTMLAHFVNTNFENRFPQQKLIRMIIDHERT